MIKECNQLVQQNVVKENIKEHHPNWPQTPDHLWRILIIEGSQYGKPDSLLKI